MHVSPTPSPRTPCLVHSKYVASETTLFKTMFQVAELNSWNFRWIHPCCNHIAELWSAHQQAPFFEQSPVDGVFDPRGPQLAQKFRLEPLGTNLMKPYGGILSPGGQCGVPARSHIYWIPLYKMALWLRRNSTKTKRCQKNVLSSSVQNAFLAT